jgi:hypothetical protein
MEARGRRERVDGLLVFAGNGWPRCLYAVGTSAATTPRPTPCGLVSACTAKHMYVKKRQPARTLHKSPVSVGPGPLTRCMYSYVSHTVMRHPDYLSLPKLLYQIATAGVTSDKNIWYYTRKNWDCIYQN